ncbi:MAG: C39 family peptidase [Oscillospiraceae bacterium]|nr:C39 family peptidase [Oscillospiraceae bacterium]
MGFGNRIWFIVSGGIILTCFSGCSNANATEESSVSETTQPVTSLTTGTAVPETTVTTTTVTISPKWAEQLKEQEKDGVIIENVPHYTQFSEYLTACESLAAVSLMRYYGIDMTPELFLDGYLPVADYPDKDSDGELHGESPWDYFIGDPMRGDAFGCYNSALAAGINKIRDGLAVAMDNVPLWKLCKNYIDKGQPVVIWGTMYMAPPNDSYSIRWYLPDGELFTFVGPEHALVLIGYDRNNYYFSDSLQYGDVTAYNKKMVEKAYYGLSAQSLVLDPLVVETVPDFWEIREEPEEDDDN